MSGRPLPFIGSREDWEGGSVTDSTVCVLAHNPGALTLDGTNTWLLQVPETDKCIVIDPGPDENSHFLDILAAARLRDCAVGAVLLTHGHSDHSAGAKAFAEMTRTTVRAVDPKLRLGDEGLTDGDVITVGQTELRVILAPGHSFDSVGFLLPYDGTLLTGDSVLGRGTSLISIPDGDLGAYLDSLDRLRELVAEQGVSWLLPGHGPALTGAGDILDAYVEHRIARLAEVREAVKSGCTTSTEVLDVVYADTPENLRTAASFSVKAQLAYLQKLGEFTTDEDLMKVPDKPEQD
ncbi:MAG: MBL fold metallo-hydrolase [Candidatus Nanopelagicales bacterium]